MCAVKKDSPEIVNLLVTAGAGLGIPNAAGETVLHYACKGTNYGYIGLFIKMGCNLAATDKEGNSALHVACAGTVSVPMVRFMLKNGADALAKNTIGITPLDLAAANANSELFQAVSKHLIEKGITPPETKTQENAKTSGHKEIPRKEDSQAQEQQDLETSRKKRHHRRSSKKTKEIQAAKEDQAAQQKQCTLQLAATPAEPLPPTYVGQTANLGQAHEPQQVEDHTQPREENATATLEPLHEKATEPLHHAAAPADAPRTEALPPKQQLPTSDSDRPSDSFTEGRPLAAQDPAAGSDAPSAAHFLAWGGKPASSVGLPSPTGRVTLVQQFLSQISQNTTANTTTTSQKAQAEIRRVLSTSAKLKIPRSDEALE
eukprot:TRINITY_DN3940_c0_g1_i3.p1 TRINITY_DN3940_c0_g1~~TRINITY_DN3940_c0_g1_i3.p1  ORF type:complete len:374 (-),score=56.08 TRINITY_DN3940_c0_g1_i3:154-1275(-)